MLFPLLSLLLALMESTLTLEKARKRSVCSILLFIQRAGGACPDPLLLHTPSSSAAKEETQVLLAWISALPFPGSIASLCFGFLILKVSECRCVKPSESFLA